MDTATSKVTAYKDPALPARLAVSEGPNWAAGFGKIPSDDAELLLSAVRTLYPHDGLSLLVYRRVVAHFDLLAGADLRAAKMLAAFCEDLRRSTPLAFHELSESYRVQALQAIEPKPAFVFVQRMSIRYLYDDIEIWAAFGYEGASVHLGGYVTRGFNDLDWLPPLPNDI